MTIETTEAFGQRLEGLNKETYTVIYTTHKNGWWVDGSPIKCYVSHQKTGRYNEYRRHCTLECELTFATLGEARAFTERQRNTYKLLKRKFGEALGL